MSIMRGAPTRPGFYQHRKPKPKPEVWQHAILSTDDRIITIGYYPRSDNSHKSVIPIPDDQHPQPGWFYNRSTKRFQKEEPE